jgi:hypothetical protein
MVGIARAYNLTNMQADVLERCIWLGEHTVAWLGCRVCLWHMGHTQLLGRWTGISKNKLIVKKISTSCKYKIYSRFAFHQQNKISFSYMCAHKLLRFTKKFFINFFNNHKKKFRWREHVPN